MKRGKIGGTSKQQLSSTRVRIKDKSRPVKLMTDTDVAKSEKTQKETKRGKVEKRPKKMTRSEKRKERIKKTKTNKPNATLVTPSKMKPKEKAKTTSSKSKHSQKEGIIPSGHRFILKKEIKSKPKPIINAKTRSKSEKREKEKSIKNERQSISDIQVSLSPSKIMIKANGDNVKHKLTNRCKQRIAIKLK